MKLNLAGFGFRVTCHIETVAAIHHCILSLTSIHHCILRPLCIAHGLADNDGRALGGGGGGASGIFWEAYQQLRSLCHCFRAEKVDDCPSADSGGQLLDDRQADMRLLNVFVVLGVLLALAPAQANRPGK